MYDQHLLVNQDFERCRITLHAETPREVRRLCRLISGWTNEQNANILHNQASRNNLTMKTYDFGNGLALTTDLLISYSLDAVEPVRVDSDGTVGKATFTIIYKGKDPE